MQLPHPPSIQLSRPRAHARVRPLARSLARSLANGCVCVCVNVQDTEDKDEGASPALGFEAAAPPMNAEERRGVPSIFLPLTMQQRVTTTHEGAGVGAHSTHEGAGVGAHSSSLREHLNNAQKHALQQKLRYFEDAGCLSKHTATHCNTLQHTATHCNTLQHTATHCNTLQRAATHCNALQHNRGTATHCNTMHY